MRDRNVLNWGKTFLPAITDRQTIRSILETDRPWSLYALGEAPGRFEHGSFARYCEFCEGFVEWRRGGYIHAR
jgi:hypothetical protein